MIILEVKTTERFQMVDVTGQVNEKLRRTGMINGDVLLYVPHTTCGITLNEGYDPHVTADILKKMAQLVPPDDGYKHLEGNSDAHIKTLLTSSSVIIPVEEGSLATGQWQRVFICEYDGPRNRKLFIKIRED